MTDEARHPVTASGGPFFATLAGVATAATMAQASALTIATGVVLALFVCKAEFDDRRNYSSTNPPTNADRLFGWSMYGCFAVGAPLCVASSTAGPWFVSVAFLIALAWVACCTPRDETRKRWLVLNSLYLATATLLAVLGLSCVLFANRFLGLALLAILALDSASTIRDEVRDIVRHRP